MTHARRLLTIALLAVMTACADPTVTNPSFGKGGSTGDPTVTGTSPTGAGLDTTLDVRVFGTNFDRSARADLALAGTVSPKVRTNSTRYVSATELVANVTIALDADTGAYDVVVTLSTGKKGIGTEMFRVQKVPPGKDPVPPPPVIPPDWTYRDLDLGAEGVYNTGYGVSDAGWVFVTDGYTGTPGLVYRTDLTPMTIEMLPSTVGGQDKGNPRGDYLTLTGPSGARENRLMMRNAEGAWRLSEPFPLPAGWKSVWAYGVNDNLLVVGHGQGRSYLTRQGDLRYYDTPIAWQLNADGSTQQTFVLNLPAPHAGCKVTNVFVEGVNLGGRIVGSTYQEAVTSKAKCVRRALYWDPPYDDPANLPRDLAPSPDPMKDPYQVGQKDLTLDYAASGINDAGDVTGWLYPSNGSVDGARAVRWMRDRYDRPEVLTGWIVYGMAIDECGRVLVGGASIGTVGIWPTGWDGKQDLPMPEGWFARGVGDIRNGRVVGSGQVSGSTSGWHAFLWTLTACPGS